MYLDYKLTPWQRFLEWLLPWRKQVRERAQRENRKWAREIDETENGGLR